MKHLVASTALALILASPALAQTAVEQQDQTEAPAAQQETLQQDQARTMDAAVQPGDILANELIGQEVYARAPDMQQQQDLQQQPPEAQAQTEAPATQPEAQQEAQARQERGAQQDRWQAFDAQELEGMDNIGQVSDVVISQDGQVRAIIVGVGGFLGIGQHEVALDLNQVSFASDPQDPTQVYLIAETSAEQLERAPEFDRAALEQDRQAMAEQAAPAQDQRVAPEDDPQATATPEEQDWRADRDPFAAPDVEREGFQQAEVAQISVDDLIGTNLYDVNDENIGNIDDVVVSEDGEVEYIVADIGGWLGIGTHTVALGLDEVTVLHDDGWADLRVYVEATQEQLETMPEHAAAN